MPTPQDYRKNFAPHDIPGALALLLEFESSMDGFFSSGFELSVDDKGGLKTWSAEPEFLNRLYPIAQANGSGSTYAFWLQDGGDLTSAPVVVFGDEGGVHVVAEDLVGLLRLLTYDTEPMIDHDGVSYYKDEDDHEASDGAGDYAAWLAEHFNQEPAGKDDVERILQSARTRYGESFRTWMKKYSEG